MVLKSIWKSLFRPSRTRTIRRPFTNPVRLEALETRFAPAVNFLQTGGVLTITGNNASDVITITEQDTPGAYNIVASETGGSNGELSRDFTRVTSLVIRTGGGEGDDIVNFLSESDANQTGLTGALSISGFGNSLTVNIGSMGSGSDDDDNDDDGDNGGNMTGAGYVNVRGATTIAFSGDETLTVNIGANASTSNDDDDDDDDGGSTSTQQGVQLGALTILSSSGAADSTITLDEQTRIDGALRITTGAGDDTITLDQVHVRGPVIVNAGFGDNDFTLDNVTINGSLSYVSQEDGDQGSESEEADLSITSSAINGSVVANLTNSQAVGTVRIVDSSVSGGVTVQGGNAADVVYLSGTSIGGGVVLNLGGGEADESAGTQAGSTVTVTDFTRILGGLSQTGIGSLDFVLDGDSIVGGSVSLSALGGRSSSTITVGGEATEDDPNTTDVDETSAGSGAYVGGIFRYTGGAGTDTISFTNASIRGAVGLALGGNGGGSTGGDESSISLSNSYIRGGLTQTGVTNGSLTYTQSDSTRIEGPVRVGTSNSGQLDFTLEGSSSIAGELSLTSGSGDDTITLDGSEGQVVVGGAVRLSLGEGSAEVTVISAEIGSAFVLSTSAQTGGDTGENGETTTLDFQRVRVGGAMIVRTGQADDSFRLDNVTVVGNFLLDTGEGNDLIAIRNSDFAGTATLNTGAGEDSVYLEAGEEGSEEDLSARDTVFRAGFSFRGGEGTDELVLGTDEDNQVVFFGNTNFNGDDNAQGDNGSGSADDLIDDQFAVFLGSTPSFRNFNLDD